MTKNPFDAERDPVLRDRLVEALTPTDTASFTSRVLAGLGEARRNPWDVLASWARPGVAAALLAASVAGYWLVMKEAGGPGPRASELLATDQRFDGNQVMDVVMGGKR